jgi:hypothetical protein
MSDTYRYLKKQQKHAIDMIECSDIDTLLKYKEYAAVAKIIDMLSQIYHDGQPLNDDQKEVLLYPWKLWGKKAGLMLYEMRKSK